MKTRQLTITGIIKGAAFAETIHGNKEKIFVPFSTRGLISKTTGGNPKILESKNSPKYFLKKGDIIVAVIVDGNKRCRKAGIWVPLAVWKEGESKIVRFFLEEVDLPFLDEIKNKKTLIRIRPPSGYGQIYYGPLDTLFVSRAHVLSRACNQKNVFEAFVGNKWVKIWPPLVAKKPKPLQQKVFGRNRKKA